MKSQVLKVQGSIVILIFGGELLLYQHTALNPTVLAGWAIANQVFIKHNGDVQGA